MLTPTSSLWGETIVGVIDITENGFCRSRIIVIVKTTGKIIIEAKINSQRVYVNGKQQTLQTDEKPFIRNGRTYIPLRFVSESADMIVDYNSNSGAILITSNNIQLSIPPVKPGVSFYVSRIMVNTKYNSQSNEFESCCLSSEEIAPPKDFIIVDPKSGKRFILARFLFETFWRIC